MADQTINLHSRAGALSESDLLDGKIQTFFNNIRDVDLTAVDIRNAFRAIKLARQEGLDISNVLDGWTARFLQVLYKPLSAHVARVADVAHAISENLDFFTADQQEQLKPAIKEALTESLVLLSLMQYQLLAKDSHSEEAIEKWVRGTYIQGDHQEMYRPLVQEAFKRYMNYLALSPSSRRPAETILIRNVIDFLEKHKDDLDQETKDAIGYDVILKGFADFELAPAA